MLKILLDAIYGFIFLTLLFIAMMLLFEVSNDLLRFFEVWRFERSVEEFLR